MKDQNETENLLVRFLNDECSESDRQELLDWINLNPQNKSDYLATKDIWDSQRNTKDNAQEQLVVFYKNQYERSRKSGILFLKWTAAVAAVFLAGLIISVFIPKKTTCQLANMQIFSVPLGSKSKLVLADGTEININSGSELSYASNFSSKNRSVSLTGEAFFHVKSDPEHPFLVKTRDFNVQVTGTQFNVCNYNEDVYSSATLAKGEINVKFNKCEKVIKVEPGEKFLLDRNSRKYTLRITDVEKEVAWKDGEFIFKNIPFPELVKRLERWYDVKLTYSDKKLMKYSFTGRFKNQETIWQVLDALRMTSPISYRKTTFREFELLYRSNY